MYCVEGQQQCWWYCVGVDMRLLWHIISDKPPGSWDVSGLRPSDILTWATQLGMISPQPVSKWRTTPWISPLGPQPQPLWWSWCLSSLALLWCQGDWVCGVRMESLEVCGVKTGHQCRCLPPQWAHSGPSTHSSCSPPPASDPRPSCTHVPLPGGAPGGLGYLFWGKWMSRPDLAQESLQCSLETSVVSTQLTLT